MIRKKLIFEIIIITMVGVSLLGCTNQRSKKAANATSASIPSNSETSKIAQPVESQDTPSSPEAGKTQQTQQKTQMLSKSNSTDKKVVEENFYGQWKIEKVLAFGPAGTYNDDDIRAIVGKQLAFSKESASCFGDKVDYLNDTAVNPTYKKTVLSKNDFKANNRITFDKLGVKGDSIIEIDADDAKGNGCTFFINDSNTLIIFGGGVYFELKRI